MRCGGLIAARLIQTPSSAKLVSGSSSPSARRIHRWILKQVQDDGFRSSRQRKPQEPVRHRHQRLRLRPHRPDDLRMARRPARRSASRRRAGSASAPWRRSSGARPGGRDGGSCSLGWKWPDSSGRGSAGSASWRRRRPSTSASSTMSPPQWIGDAGIVVAGDPGPAGRSGEGDQHLAGPRGKAVAAVAVVEAVAEAPDLLGAGRDGERGEIGEGGDRIVGRKHLPQPGEPARFLEMEVGDQQGPARRPEQGPLRSAPSARGHRTKSEP